MIGKVLDGRYKVIQVLGWGGFAQTFIAEDTRRPNNPKCVVKQLKPIMANDPNLMQTARRLFQTEAEALERLGSHDRVPRLLAHFEENNEFYMVQDIVDGHDLAKELIDGRKQSEAYVIDLLRELLPVLSFVHGQGVIHRDIKPSNIMRQDSDGKLVLIDFGAVKYINTQTAMAHGLSGSVAIGTDGYTPSEQLRGKPRPSSDIYSLGMVCLQALTGIYPKDLPEDADEEINWQHLAVASPALTSILNKMVSHNTKGRYKEASEVIQDLNALLPSSSPQPAVGFSRDSFFNAAPQGYQPNANPTPSPRSEPPVNPQQGAAFSRDSFFNAAPQSPQPNASPPQSQPPANPQQGGAFSRDSFFNAAPQNPQPDVAPTPYPQQNYVPNPPPQAPTPPPSQAPTYVVPGVQPLPPTAPTPPTRSGGGSNKILLIAAVVISLGAIGAIGASLFNRTPNPPDNRVGSNLPDPKPPTSDPNPKPPTPDPNPKPPTSDPNPNNLTVDQARSQITAIFNNRLGRYPTENEVGSILANLGTGSLTIDKLDRNAKEYADSLIKDAEKSRNNPPSPSYVNRDLGPVTVSVYAEGCGLTGGCPTKTATQSLTIPNGCTISGSPTVTKGNAFGNYTDINIVPDGNRIRIEASATGNRAFGRGAGSKVEYTVTYSASCRQ